MTSTNQMQSILKNNGSKISPKSSKRKSKRKGISPRKMTTPKKANDNSQSSVLTQYEQDHNEYEQDPDEFKWPATEPIAKTNKNDKANQKDAPASRDKQN